MIREVGMAARVNKKSRKREKQMDKVKKTLKVRLRLSPLESLDAQVCSLILNFMYFPTETQKFKESSSF